MSRDAELVAAFLAARAGPPSAESRRVELAFVVRIRPLVERCAAGRYTASVRDRGRAPSLSVHDLVQGFFARLFERPVQLLGRFSDARGELDGYLYVVAERSMKNMLRSDDKHVRRGSGTEVPHEPPPSPLHPPPPPPPDPVGGLHLGRVLDVFRAEAPPLEVAMFDAIVVEERPAAELKASHGWSTANTANVWRFRIVARLRKISQRLTRAS